jgi:hypothetical protein
VFYLHATVHQAVGVCILIPIDCQEGKKIEVEQAVVCAIHDVAQWYHIDDTLNKVAPILLVCQEYVHRSTFKAIEEEHDLHYHHEDAQNRTHNGNSFHELLSIVFGVPVELVLEDKPVNNRILIPPRNIGALYLFFKALNFASLVDDVL